MKSTDRNSFKTDVLDSKKVVLVDVWATWCPPCRAMMPVIEQVAEETKDWADVVKLDVTEDMDMAQSLGVNSLPTFITYKDGQVVSQSVGATSKSNLIEMMSHAK